LAIEDEANEEKEEEEEEELAVASAKPRMIPDRTRDGELGAPVGPELFNGFRTGEPTLTEGDPPPGLWGVVMLVFNDEELDSPPLLFSSLVSDVLPGGHSSCECSRCSWSTRLFRLFSAACGIGDRGRLRKLSDWAAVLMADDGGDEENEDVGVVLVLLLVLVVVLELVDTLVADTLVVVVVE
jgi:hypothetical protein